jgi:hypothetical protein
MTALASGGWRGDRLPTQAASLCIDEHHIARYHFKAEVERRGWEHVMQRAISPPTLVGVTGQRDTCCAGIKAITSR